MSGSQRWRRRVGCRSAAPQFLGVERPGVDLDSSCRISEQPVRCHSRSDSRSNVFSPIRNPRSAATASCWLSTWSFDEAGVRYMTMQPITKVIEEEIGLS